MYENIFLLYFLSSKAAIHHWAAKRRDIYGAWNVNSLSAAQADGGDKPYIILE